MKNLIRLTIFVVFSSISGVSYASEFSPQYFDRLVQAIYHAEGGANTRHPYGILQKYKTTTPKQACFNTVRNQYKRHLNHNCGKEYLVCLRDRYAPLKASNDPTNLNDNWLKNVRRLMEKSKWPLIFALQAI